MRFQRLEISLFGIGWMATGISVGANSFVLMEIAFLALGLTGLLRIARVILDRDRHWSLCSIVAGAMMPSYFIGGFITLLQYDPNLPDFALPGGDGFLGEALVAIIYLSLFYWALALLAPYENRYWQQSLKMLSSPAAWRGDEAARPAVAAGLIAMISAQLYLFVSGGVTLSGIDVTTDPHLPIGAILVINLSDPILAISAWILGRWQAPFSLVRLAILTAACQIPWLGGLGRRYILYGAVVFLSTFFWARGKRKSNRIIYLAIPVLGIVYFSTKLFVAMRYANYSYGDTGAAQSLTTLYSDAFSLLSTDADMVAEAEKENYASRFFILGSLITTIDGISLPVAQAGKFLFIALFNCIPSLILPGKTELMSRLSWGGDGKALMNDLLGLQQLDFAYTPMLVAYVDFMWLGPLLYPFFVLLLGWLFSRLTQSMRYPSFVIAGLGLCFMEFLGTEVGLSVYILTGRTLAFVWVISKIVSFFDRPAAG